MSKTPRNTKVTVSVATYARPALLLRAVHSVVGQLADGDELLVIAWSGDDESSHALKEVAAMDSVRVLRSADNTVVAKENAAIDLATGEIVCFMDDDAAARADWLDRIVAWYADPSVGAVGGRDVVRTGDRGLDEPARDIGRVRWYGRLIGNHHRLSSGTRDVDFLKGVNMSFRRALLPRIDERLAGPIPYGFEIDLGLHVRALGYRVVYDPAIVVDHYSTSDYTASGPIAWKVNHNQTYVLLKRLPSLRKFTFLAYTFLLGDRNTIGLLRVPFLIVRDRWTIAAIAPHFRGKLAGVRAYARSCRVPSEPGGA